MAETIMEQVKEKFTELFGGEGDIREYYAPGRVNLIGEHTDYNGGHVFPCALSMGHYAAARKRDDKKVRWYFMNYPENGLQEWEFEGLNPNDNGLWYDYQLGVAWALQQKGYEITNGYDMVMCGNMPTGSGLSASASIEMVAAVILNDLLSLGLSNVDLALAGQYSENHYNGMNCGIMDQFASAMGKAGHAIFLDTADLSYRYVPLNMTGKKIVIVNSMVKHQLAGSAYNDRRRESEEALKDLQTVTEIKSLGDLDSEGFEKYQSAIKDPVCRKRARHAVLENQRTIQAVEALNADDINRFGKLMNESHVSLRDDYEVSCEELDVLAEEAWKLPYVIGARMTGGGFGGCTVNIVEEDSVEEFKKILQEAYQKRTGKTAEFYIADPADGAGRI